MSVLTTTELLAEAPGTTPALEYRAHALNLPAESGDDLRGIVGERGLVKLALQSVQHFGSDLPLWYATTEPAFSSRMLLALLTYSYAAGIYGSEDIHWACKRDAGARYLCANTWPEEQSLRRFRRKWRPLIQSCLQWVCTVAETTRSIRLAESGNPAKASIALPAEQRIEAAILMDMAACD